MQNSISSQKFSSPKISLSPKIVDITNDVVQTTTNPQKYDVCKTKISAKTTISYSKTPTADPKSTDPKAAIAKAAAENIKSAKTSTAFQTIPERKLKMLRQ